MVLPSSSRGGIGIDWAALHSAEGARTVGSLFDFFNRGQHASSHAGADGYQLSEPWVPDERAAWTLLNGNPRSLNLELCGFAHWTREEWLSEGWVDGVWNPRQMIRHAAQWLREKCDKHNIPRRLLTPEEVGRGERGIIDHFRYTVGKKDGNHTDVGKNFPFDVLFADMNEEDDMPLDGADINKIWSSEILSQVNADTKAPDAKLGYASPAHQLKYSKLYAELGYNVSVAVQAQLVQLSELVKAMTSGTEVTNEGVAAALLPKLTAHLTSVVGPVVAQQLEAWDGVELSEQAREEFAEAVVHTIGAQLVGAVKQEG